MMDSQTLLLICLTFLVAGGVKGVIGLGMPTISLALLTATQGLHAAMALLLVPTFLTNIWQGVTGGYLKEICRRLWLFFGAAIACVWPGVMVLARVDVSWLSALLGMLIILYAMLGLLQVRMVIADGRRIGWAGVAGGLSGLLTGMTGSSVFPGVVYLQASGLPRDALIQAMGILFSLLTLSLGIAMGGERLLSSELLGLSTFAVLPALLGMHMGRRLRQRLSEALFRKVFLYGLLSLGLYILWHSLH